MSNIFIYLCNKKDATTLCNKKYGTYIIEYPGTLIPSEIRKWYDDYVNTTVEYLISYFTPTYIDMILVRKKNIRIHLRRRDIKISYDNNINKTCEIFLDHLNNTWNNQTSNVILSYTNKVNNKTIPTIDIFINTLTKTTMTFLY